MLYKNKENAIKIPTFAKNMKNAVLKDFIFYLKKKKK